MVYLKLAFQGILRNKKEYLPYIITTSILFSSCDMLLMLLNNSSIIKSTLGNSFGKLIEISLTFVIPICFFIICYINHIINKNESKEFGLYNMLGLAKKNLKWVTFFRSVITYFMSAFLGWILAINFNKFAFLTLVRMLKLSEYKYYFSTEALFSTCLLFAIFFMVVNLVNYFKLKNINPINLWKTSEKNERDPKTPWVSGLIGIVVLCIGYCIALRTKPCLDALIKFQIAIFCVIIGIFLLFNSFSILLLKALRKSKKYYYQSNHFIAVSGMLHRMRQNGTSLGAICLLCTAVIVGMITTCCIKAGEENILKLWNPYDVILNSKQKISQTQAVVINETARKNGIKIIDRNRMKMTVPIYGNFNHAKFDEASVSNAKYQLSFITLADYNRIEKKHIKLNENQALLYCPDYFGKNQILQIGGKKLKVEKLKRFKMYYDYQHTVLQPVFVVLQNQKLCDKLAQRSPWIEITMFNTKGKYKNNVHFANQLQQNLGMSSEFYTAYYQTKQEFIPIFNGALFITIIVSIILIIITVMMIYFKQLSEGREDKYRFRTMRQIGMSNKEVKQTIHSQVLMVFMLPIVGAIINTAFAFPAIKNILKLFSIYNLNLVIFISGLTSLIMIVGYLLIYAVTTKIYQQMVK